MTIWSLLLIAISESCGIVGQIFFKLAMQPRKEAAKLSPAAALFYGILAMTIAFFVWLGLLAKYDLSFLYPFDGLNRLILLVAAAVFLKEKVTPQLWIGVLLISVGVAIVATS